MSKAKISNNFSFQGKKRKTKMLTGIACFTIIAVIGLQFGTQYIASQFGYSPHLGNYLLKIGRTPIYSFWQGVSWFWQLREYYGKNDMVTHLFGVAGYIFAGLFLLAAVAMRLLFRKDGMSAQEALHGSAHWANRDEIIEAGLLASSGAENEEGVVVGGWLSGKNLNSLKTLRHNGKEHILVFAPTRSGKGVGLVLPTLLGEWRGSTFILDIKGENLALSAGYKKSLKHEVYIFDPSDFRAAREGTSVTFNPLEEIELDYEEGENDRMIRTRGGETAQVQRLATILADPLGKGLEDHWAKTGQALLVGAITHLLYYGHRNGFCPSLADVAQELSKPGEDWIETIAGWQNYPHLGYNEHNEPICHPVVAISSQEMVNRDPKEGSSVLSTATSFLTLYQDPVIADNTRVSSFKINDLMNREKPVHLYFVVRPVDLARLQPFIRLFVTQLIYGLAAKMEFSEGASVAHYRHRLLLLLDEFPALGKLPIFETAIGFIGGYGLKSYVIVQDLAQLHSAYGKDEKITGNCHIQIAYSPNNQETAEVLSKMIGTTTVIKESVSESGKRTDLFHNQTSVSMQEVNRPLLTPDECRRLPGAKKDPSTGNITMPGDMLIFPSGFAPVYGKQKLYFMDEELDRRSKLNPPSVSDHAIDMIARQAEIAEIKTRLKSEGDEMRRIKKQIEELGKDGDPSLKASLQSKLDNLDGNSKRNKSRPANTRGLPPHKT